MDRKTKSGKKHIDLKVKSFGISLIFNSSKKEVELSFCFLKSKLDFLRHAVHQCHCEPLDEKQFPHQTSLLFYEVVMNFSAHS